VSAPLKAPKRIYTGRFFFFYAVLGVVLVGAIAGVVVLAEKPGPPKPPPWSSWRPAGGSTQTMSGEIISHISHQYKSDKKGDQLVVVFPSAPEVNQNIKNYNVSTIAVRSSATSQNLSRIITTSGITQQQFCGLGDSCSIEKGTATADRERLVRREALEIALYTFKYVPSVNGILAYMPPPPGQPPSTLLFLERSGLQKQLSEPIAKTLPLTTPPLPTSADSKESNTIDKLTLPAEYGFQYQLLPNKTQAIILAPSGY
jgi:hypothetical protein